MVSPDLRGLPGADRPTSIGWRTPGPSHDGLTSDRQCIWDSGRSAACRCRRDTEPYTTVHESQADAPGERTLFTDTMGTSSRAAWLVTCIDHRPSGGHRFRTGCRSPRFDRHQRDS